MNKKGSLGLAILTSIGIFIIGFMFLNFLLPEVTDFRTNMNCADASNIHDGTKILCLIGDGAVPLYILGIVSLAIGVIIERFVI